MKNMIEELYYGNVNPNEKVLNDKSEYEMLVHIISEYEYALNDRLKGEEKQLFFQLINAQCEILDIEGREKFIEGWRLGAKFVMDTFIIGKK